MRRGRLRPPADEAQALPLAEVAVEGRDADQGGGLAAAHGAQFGHAHDQGGGDDGPDARQAGQQPEAGRQIGARP